METVSRRSSFSRPVLSGERIGALALTEPHAGSDAGSVKTRARREGGDFALNGENRFITNGGVADYLCLFAVTDSSKPARSGLSAFVIPRNSKGLEVVRAYDLLGMRALMWPICGFATLVCQEKISLVVSTVVSQLS